ncbi:hypothetical protein CC80DRAFT_492027 [Byssothecium circinans]|uniref:Nephrocystin 3-like N-terminal domain-containing protein n=1 Tax=Byssothecium circinans TaxID=147558 RepID=A0A6A5TX60_9PLEO|nr:hypothetical protein CC80DRAFT_492027 [Byssothecium circinans]
MIRALSVTDKAALQTALRFPEIEERQVAIKDAYEATCEWFLQSADYCRWRNPSEKMNGKNAFLQINGDTGTGKSTLMKFAFTQHRARYREHHAIAYFPTSRGTEAENTAKGAYRALLVQVLEGMETIPCGPYVLEQWLRREKTTWDTSALKELL